MRSIRGRLTGWFLAGFGVLWLVAGAAVYFSYRAGLVAGMEAELQTMCRQVRSVGMAGGGGPGRGGRWMEQETDTAEVLGPDVMWQVWRTDGEEVSRSDNLTADLPPPDEGRATIVDLADGTRVMSVGHHFGGGGGPGGQGGGGGQGRGRWGMGGPGGGMDISVARPLDALQAKLLRMALLIAGSGVVLAGLGWMWVRFVVHDGLSPLCRIADEIGSIDSASLDGRFANDGLPSELEPIVDRLNRLMDRLEGSFARERRFSADLAHEMRTPIAEAKTIAESAVKWPEEGGPEAWQDVVASVARMEAVVQSMLQLARLEREQPGAKGEPFPLARIVNERWADHASVAEARDVRLRSEVAADAMVVGDRGWWDHLLGNLLGNAAEYADAGSEVVITMEDDGAVTISNRASGLAAEDVGHLFDRFWRADEARGESTHCGLGLSLAKACADALGLQLEANLGEGGVLEMRVTGL
ncbi:sensor histidine kinase [Haloferula helveola]|uniref:histidine kinase n=1 Tax=Haloferula helveola TaxID=490095 RepID=A0ABM7R994_9BACT|nr:sensor histidine kinase [Haloferula helveola]